MSKLLKDNSIISINNHHINRMKSILIEKEIQINMLLTYKIIKVSDIFLYILNKNLNYLYQKFTSSVYLAIFNCFLAQIISNPFLFD
jgi:hypothetical protein